jgi:hypothetical protein
MGDLAWRPNAVLNGKDPRALSLWFVYREYQAEMGAANRDLHHSAGGCRALLKAAWRGRWRLSREPDAAALVDSGLE